MHFISCNLLSDVHSKQIVILNYFVDCRYFIKTEKFEMETEVKAGQNQDEADDREVSENPSCAISLENDYPNNEKNSSGQVNQTHSEAQAQNTNPLNRELVVPGISQPQIDNDSGKNLEKRNLEMSLETNAVTVKAEPNNEIPLDESIPAEKEVEAQTNSAVTQNLQQTNTEIAMETNTITVKAEPDHFEIRSGESMPVEKEAEAQINSAATQNLQQTNTEIAMETNAITVKAEPDHFEIPIDENMPIAKDSSYLSVNSIGGKPLSEIINKATVSELDKELQDGIATAVMPTRPRLRVKPELSFILPATSTDTQQPASMEACKNSANSSEHLNKEDLMLPPPPPTILSANSNSDFLADGIATPRIALLAVNRLRVKTEFSCQSNEADNEEESRIPHEFFDDLLEAKSPKEKREIMENDGDLDSADIPADFFDDLLPPEVKESLEQENPNEYEENYSEKLKRNQGLGKDYKTSREKHKSHKKQKKSKRKTRRHSRSRSRSSRSRTRTRSRSRSPKYYRARRDRNFRNISPDHFSLENSPQRLSRRKAASPVSPATDRKRRRLSPLRLELPTKSRNSYRNEDMQANYALHPQGIKQEISETLAPKQNMEEIEKPLTPKQKRERAIKRATVLLNHLKNLSSNDNYINTSFQFASGVRKLPTSQSYVQQQIFENRSPLHTIHNVRYEFNSHQTRFNLEEWGLETLPPNASRLAKRIGCSAQFIYDKLKIIKIPAKLKKIKNESLEQNSKEEGEELLESRSSFFCNAMTQTEENTAFQNRSKEKAKDIAIQAGPSCYSIACQTLECEAPTINQYKNDEEKSPIMKVIRDLNENQLMAIHSFAELIKEPAMAEATAMDMYKIQMKIMDIYKISQIPSAVMPSPQSQSHILNNYTTASRPYETYRHEMNTQPIKQSVKSAEGPQFPMHDGRIKTFTYNGRNIEASLTYNNSNGRYQGASSSTYRQYQPPYPHNQASSGAIKHYGRGALRR